jgi:hypothetical protein
VSAGGKDRIAEKRKTKTHNNNNNNNKTNTFNINMTDRLAELQGGSSWAQDDAASVDIEMGHTNTKQMQKYNHTPSTNVAWVMTMNDDDGAADSSNNPPFFQPIVQNSSLPKEDITCVFNEIQESTSSMDDEPVWDKMSDIEEDSAFATSQRPPLATRKITHGFDVDSSKVEDLPDGLFGWFTDDVIKDVEPTKSPTDVSPVSVDSSDKLSDDEDLRPTVSLEDQDRPSVCKLLNVMGDIDVDVDVDLDGPVFGGNILDPNLSLASIGAAMFDFLMSNSPLPVAAFPPGKNQTSFPSPAVHLSTLDPLPYSSPSFVTPALQETITSVVTPERQDSIEIMAMDLLAYVATDDSKELLDLATDSCFDSCSENEMMTSHQSSEKKSKKCGSAWMKKFEQLRGECLM